MNHIKLTSDKTDVICTIKTESGATPLNHATSHIKDRVKTYAYLEGDSKVINGQTEYTLSFEPLHAQSSIELYIELKSGKKITIPIDLTAY